MTPQPERLVLASASPRRRELLDAIGVRHDVVPAHAPEPDLGALPPKDHARAAALAKAREIAARLPGRLILAADTVVALGGEPRDVLGKPSDDADAARMLGLLSGRTHDVVTAVALARDGVLRLRHRRTEVTFRTLPPALIARYVATGEPRDKAGAYAVQGRLAPLVERVVGSWSNVVGLPLEELPALFVDAGEDLARWQDW